MARWVSGSGRWMDCHCVLTRCGFLHWFAGNPPDPADIVPADSLSLARYHPWLSLAAGHASMVWFTWQIALNIHDCGTP